MVLFLRRRIRFFFVFGGYVCVRRSRGFVGDVMLAFRSSRMFCIYRKMSDYFRELILLIIESKVKKVINKLLGVIEFLIGNI